MSHNCRHMELHLFYNGPLSLEIAIEGRIDAIIVDCEESGKRERQQGFDTEINRWCPTDCSLVRRSAPSLRIICRIDSFRKVGPSAISQALAAVDAGADEVILPMVDHIDEIQAVLDALAGRAQVGAMIETDGAIAIADQIDQLPLSRVFVGLNDLMIERRSRHLFEHLLDGTVESLRSRIRKVAFGFGGMTLPDRGHPVPCRLLIGELARLGCSFTFLRRSFFRDLAHSGLDPASAVERMRSAWEIARSRAPEAVEAEHAELQSTLRRVVSGPD